MEAGEAAVILRSESSENYGDLDDYLQEYEDGKLTAEAKAIYEAILENGLLDTVRLRREARMSADSAKSRFDRALVELQVGLKLVQRYIDNVMAVDRKMVAKVFHVLKWTPKEFGRCRGRIIRPFHKEMHIS